MAKKFTVVAHLPTAVELSRRTTQNSLRVDVKISDSKEGTLNISQGTVEWWPDRNKVNAHRADWEKFAEIMEKHLPMKRSTRERRQSPPVNSAAARRATSIRRKAAKKAWVTIRAKREAAKDQRENPSPHL